MPAFAAHVVYALAWISFGFGHSLLAGAAVKTALACRFGAGYRLFYNAFAALHIGAVLWIGGWAFEDAPSFGYSTDFVTVQTVVSAIGLIVLVVALLEYDLGRFSGLAQIRAARAGNPIDDDEALITGGLHAYVRHPLYAGAHLILWGGVGDELSLATAAWGSLYLVVGARFEERRLLALYGEAYAEYRRRVPALVPYRGRFG